MTYESEDTTMGQIKDMLVENEGLAIELGHLREEYTAEFNKHTETLSKLTRTTMERDQLAEDLAYEIEYAHEVAREADYWRESYDVLASVHAAKLEELNNLQTENGYLCDDISYLAASHNAIDKENVALRKIRDNLHNQLDWAIEDHLAAVNYAEHQEAGVFQLQGELDDIETAVFDIYANAIAKGNTSDAFLFELMGFTIDNFPDLIPAINREFGLDESLGAELVGK